MELFALSVLVKSEERLYWSNLEEEQVRLVCWFLMDITRSVYCNEFEYELQKVERSSKSILHCKNVG